MKLTIDEIDKGFTEAMTAPLPGGRETFTHLDEWCDVLYRRFGSGSLVGAICFAAGMLVGMQKEKPDEA